MDSLPSAGAVVNALPPALIPLPKPPLVNDPETAESASLKARIQEVLENGGFLSLPRTRKAARDGVDVYEYQRLSRDGQPLTGAEAKRPPRYVLTAWGKMALSCTCPRARRSGEVCKHEQALTRELMGRSALLEQATRETGGQL